VKTSALTNASDAICVGWTGCWALKIQLPDDSPSTTYEVATRCGACSSAAPKTVPRIVAHGLWELLRHTDQLTAGEADPKDKRAPSHARR